MDLKRIQQELRYGKKKGKKGREEINKNVAERLPVIQKLVNFKDIPAPLWLRGVRDAGGADLVWASLRVEPRGRGVGASKGWGSRIRNKTHQSCRSGIDPLRRHTSSVGKRQAEMDNWMKPVNKTYQDCLNWFLFYLFFVPVLQYVSKGYEEDAGEKKEGNEDPKFYLFWAILHSLSNVILKQKASNNSLQ